MKICIVSYPYPGISIGGIERYLSNLIKELTKRNHKIYVITASYDKEITERGENLIVYKRKFMNLEDKENSKRNSEKLLIFLTKLIEDEEIDLICAENFYRSVPASFVFVINMTCFYTKIPLVLRMHGHCSQELEKAFLRDMLWDKIAPVSKNLSENAYNAGVDVEKINTIYPGIDTDLFRPKLGKGWLRSRVSVSDKDIVILLASRITGSKSSSLIEEKGISTLLKAFSMIKDKKIKLLIAAARPPVIWKKKFDIVIKKIKSLCKLYNIENRVFVESFSLDQMPLVYNGADIYVLASRMESLGLSYIEAMSCELPVIGTSVGGIPEVISDGEDGYLIEQDNPVELSKRLNILIKSHKKRLEMGKKGRKNIISKFNNDIQTERIIGLFKSCIEKKRNKEIIKEPLAPIDKVIKKLINVFSPE